MRHSCGNRKLSKATDQRLALLRSLVRSLFLHGKIKTSLARAKQAKRSAEKMISLAQKNDLFSRRKAEAFFGEKAIVTHMFKLLPERFEGRAGGYTRITRVGFRRGDAAPLVLLELI